MRLLHTSDLHLGRQLCGESRGPVFGKLLDWLLELIRKESVDVLVIAGDVFDSPTPPTAAQHLYYSFLARLRETGCQMAVVVAGNHDSPQLINAPKEVLLPLGVHVAGRAAKDPADEVLILRNEDGSPRAAFCAVPFLREADIRTLSCDDTLENRGERLTQGIAEHYRKAVNAALEALGDARPRVPLIATGHLFVRGGSAGTGERELYVGSLGDVPAAAFPEEIDYLALGHLHKPQKVDGNIARNYCGAPLALDFSEGSSPRFVNLVEFEGKTPTVTPIAVPAFDRIATVRGDESEIHAQLQGLAHANEPALIEIIHEGTKPMPMIAETAKEILADSPVRVLRIRDEARRIRVLSGEDTARDLAELTPAEVFGLRLDKAEVPAEERAELAAAYEEILQRVTMPEASDTEEETHTKENAR